MPALDQFENVTAVAKANVYFGGKVVSHSILFPDGSKKTLGLIFPGKYHFDTQAAEIMQIVDGACRVKLAGSDEHTGYGPGQEFRIPADSGFDIAVETGVCQYVCSFITD